MSDLTDSDIAKPTLGKSDLNESTFRKTVRLTTNLMTNMTMCLTVFVSLLYAFSSEKITVFQLHIILCVMGYQLFMCQGTLVISKYNSWSLYVNRRHKKQLHIIFQFFGLVLVMVGSGMILSEKEHYFTTTHGCLGIVALIISTISVINGVLANYAYKFNYFNVVVIKFIHFTSGILTLIISAAALSTGFEEFSFRVWVNDDHAVSGLILITWIFTLLVALDFWLLTGQRLRNLSRPISCI